ncbi:MAG: phage scaffolding protein [Eubacteriales bacterium]
MNKEELIKLGISETVANQIMESLNGSFVPKSRFNEINTELATARGTIKERDTQLEALKKSTGDVDALKAQITALQTENDKQKKAHEAEMKSLRVGNAVDLASDRRARRTTPRRVR